MNKPNNRTVFKIVIVVAICLLCAQLRYGSKSFDIDDPTQSVTIEYHKPWFVGNFSLITLRSEGNFQQGSAIVKVYDRDRKKDTLRRLVIDQRLKGTFDVTSTYDYYDNRVYILYKPKGILKGKVKVTVTID